MIYSYSMFTSQAIQEFMDAIPVSLIVAVPDEKIQRDVYFKILYMNTFSTSLLGGYKESDSSLFHMLEKVDTDVDWMKFGSSAFQSREPVSVGCFSERLAKWLSITFCYFEKNYLLVTVTDITTAKEQESLFRRYAQKTLSAPGVNLEKRVERTEDIIKTLTEKLEQISYYDALTGLANMSSYNEVVSAAVKDAEEKGFDIGLMLLDLDNLKDINDLRGHTAGNAVLRKVAQILRKFEQHNILPFRFGGDEFILLAVDVGSYNRMVDIGNMVMESCHQSEVSVSAGIAVYPHDAHSEDELLRFADLAMHEVKKNGKNDISFFNSSMQKDFLKRLSLETKLSIAVLNGSFQLYFQPQIDLHKNRLRGFEALIRWHDPEIGWISPADFIPVAEETKLIQTIGLWVLENCISTWKDWHAKYNFNGIMSINVSPVQLQKTEFLQDVSRLIAKYQVDPSKLEIEVTEGIFIDNSEEIIGQLRQIKNMGLGIALDDFGTGYSSLNYLQRIPLTVLKIDKSFVNNLSEKDSVEKNITESIISLVNKMGLETIAEGIETIEQFTVLKKMNCDFIQGFLAGKPMSLQNCSQFLSGDFSVVQQVPEAGAITYSL